ncbi:hypothetical protein [Marinomonas shanghaiensis]|uniref:hypothetical protein n=1 Tax=Marinomonas shanghaiensis TaxID=2202418 RepID=UPI000DBAD9EF|nr:hypothetical protein [Marinomonas shanghaiensis]
MNEIIDHKIVIIHHSLARINEVYRLAKDHLDTNLTSQDSIIFNPAFFNSTIMQQTLLCA